MITPKGRGKLHTPVTGYAVKLVLITLIPAGEGSFTPEAGFEGSRRIRMEELVSHPPECLL